VFESTLFLLSASLTVGGAFAVVYTKNLMHACVYLLASLFGVAGLYATLGADFLAATQIVVYAGGVVVLMLFAIMLTGGVENDVSSKRRFLLPASMGTPKTYIVASLSVLVISMVVLKIIASAVKGYEVSELPPFESTVEQIGILLVTDHVLAFEISSVLLLGALVGAAVIARPRRNN
jgi:NADH:ubiquinone oxidoreductase subunit 6 (subunit J)